MKNKVTIENHEYEVIKNHREAYNEEDFMNRISDYFFPYDYIVGDYAYNKLRLKGFYEADNKAVKDLNNIKYVEAYLENNCAVDCRHFILKKT